MREEEQASARGRAEKYLAECAEYTDPYEHEKLVRDWVKKGDVAKNVVGDFTRRAGAVKGKKLIDLGFGNGQYVTAFAQAGAEAHGLEVNPVLLRIAEENLKENRVRAELGVYDGNAFPYPDNFFDYAFSVAVLEHVSNPKRFLRETSRVLKQGGRFYLAFPNRISPKETHTGIWGLNYVSRSFAQFLLRRIWKRNTVEEINLHFISYWKMKQLAERAGLFVRYELEGKTGLRSMLKRLLATLGMHHSAILRTVMVVLEKRPK